MASPERQRNHLGEEPEQENWPEYGRNDQGGVQAASLAVAGDGTAYVADLGGRQVVKVAPDGRVDTASESEPPWAPTGVAVAGDDLYLLEVGSSPARASFGPRVRKVSPGGKSEVLATVPE